MKGAGAFIDVTADDLALGNTPPTGAPPATTTRLQLRAEVSRGRARANTRAGRLLVTLEVFDNATGSTGFHDAVCGGRVQSAGGAASADSTAVSETRAMTRTSVAMAMLLRSCRPSGQAPPPPIITCTCTPMPQGPMAPRPPGSGAPMRESRCTSGPPALLERWSRAGGDRIIPALWFGAMVESVPTPAEVRRAFGASVPGSSPRWRFSTTAIHRAARSSPTSRWRNRWTFRSASTSALALPARCICPPRRAIEPRCSAWKKR